MHNTILILLHQQQTGCQYNRYPTNLYCQKYRLAKDNTPFLALPEFLLGYTLTPQNKPFTVLHMLFILQTIHIN